MSVPLTVIAVLITTCYAPLKLPKLEELDKKSLSNKTKDLVTTKEVPPTKMDLALDLVVVMLTDVGVIPSASGTEIAVVISMMSVDLVMVIVVDTVVPVAGAIPSVPDMVTVVSISTTYVVPSVDHVVDLVVVMLTDVGVMLTVSTMEIAVVISMMSVDLVMEIVVDTVVPDVGAMMFVLPMEIAVLIITCYAPLIKKEC